MQRKLVIDGRLIHDDGDCFVIAEIGHNHQGDLQKAKELFRQAKNCGADSVKLQKRDNKSLYTTGMYNKPYEHKNSFGATYGEHREFLEFSLTEYQELKRYAKELDLPFFATAFDIPSANFLNEVGVAAYKIASGDLKNIPLIKHIAEFQKPVIVSTGGGNMEDIQRVYDVIMPINQQLCFLQCTATYPTAPEEVNLLVIAALRKNFPNLVIGLSDHYNGIAMALAAYILGARVLEKHFTLNHTWKGSDHALSLEPIGMSKMIRDLRRARLALGDGIKKCLPSENAAITKMGKSLYASRNLIAGQPLTTTDIAIKSPGGGIPPFEIDRVLGMTLRRSVESEEPLRYEDLVSV